MGGDGVHLTDDGTLVIATAIHAGHEVRPEVAARLAIDEATRLREEDPYTDRLAALVPSHVLVSRSRFEVDLNRPRDKAIYLEAADSWGIQVWREPCSDELVAGSLGAYDRFYAALDRLLQDRVRRGGGFVVLDLHSYNHRRGGAGGEAADPAANPEINLGTGTVDRARWGALVDRFAADLAASQVGGHRLDVRENVKFRGGAMSAWINQRFAGAGCALAIELKKTFMDEWTGELDTVHLAELGRALAATLPGLRESLAA
jgi:N-formylglutamate amidohydrolase